MGAAMTRSERFKNNRLWLKTEHFAVTNSLRATLEKSGLSEEDQIRLAYIQNKVLTVVDEGQWAFVPRSYWRNKCNWGYTRYLEMLRRWGQLEINPSYWASEDDESGFPKSFRVPQTALADGVCNLNFKRKRFRSPTPDNRPTDEASHYALKCLSNLNVVRDELFWLPDDPIRRSQIKNACENIAFKNFRLGYGLNSKRLFHHVIMMPSEGRCNLRFPFFRLVESDVKSCHPLLLLTLFTDPIERKRYQDLLNADIYTSIGNEMGIQDRDKIKTNFLSVINDGDKTQGWYKKQSVFEFFANEFPIFTKTVLSVRTDLAIYLQNLEAELFVQKLGIRCKENNLFWFPQHDGWISLEEDNLRIKELAKQIIFKEIDFETEIVTEIINKEQGERKREVVEDIICV